MHPRVQLFQQTNTGRLIEQILLKCSRTDVFTFSEDMEFNMDHIINRTKYILDLTSITLRCITQRLDVDVDVAWQAAGNRAGMAPLLSLIQPELEVTGVSCFRHSSWTYGSFCL